MDTSLISADPTISYSVKEVGPIVVALAFVIAVGGVAAAAILVCGWQKIKGVNVNVTQRRIEIACK